MKVTRVGLGVLLFRGPDEILLGQRLNAHGALTWGPPGGHLEFGESFEACASRECLEEVGVKIQAIEFVALTNDFLRPKTNITSLFL